MKSIRYLDFQCPLKVISEANQSNREHWAAKMKRRQEQQMMMAVALHANLQGRKIELPCVVRLTRIGPKALDSDNLSSAFKATRDLIASKLGVDDGSDQIRFEYDQFAIRIREYAVKVSITSQKQPQLNQSEE
jgi:hypothetical protein